jgi:hypothetical protein
LSKEIALPPLDYGSIADRLSRARILIDAQGHLEVRLGESAPGVTVEVAPERLSAASGACNRPFSAEAKAPVLVGIDKLAPLIDPVLWTDFCSIQTSDQQVDRPCLPDGWYGTIKETIFLSIGGETYVNILNIQYCYGSGTPRVDFSLKESLEGDLVMDSGFLDAAPGELFGSWLSCQKTLQYREPSFWCRVPDDDLQLILLVFIKLLLLQYSFRVMKFVWGGDTLSEAERLLHAAEGRIWLVAEMAKLGFDAEAGLPLPGNAFGRPPAST